MVGYKYNPSCITTAIACNVKIAALVTRITEYRQKLFFAVVFILEVVFNFVFSFKLRSS